MHDMLYKFVHVIASSHLICESTACACMYLSYTANNETGTFQTDASFTEMKFIKTTSRSMLFTYIIHRIAICFAMHATYPRIPSDDIAIVRIFERFNHNLNL